MLTMQHVIIRISTATYSLYFVTLIVQSRGTAWLVIISLLFMIVAHTASHVFKIKSVVEKQRWKNQSKTPKLPTFVREKKGW